MCQACSWLSLEDMYSNLATEFIDVIVKGLQPSQQLSIKVIALGALTYVDARLGINHLPDGNYNNIRNFLRLRLYHVPLHRQSGGLVSPYVSPSSSSEGSLD